MISFVIMYAHLGEYSYWKLGGMVSTNKLA